MCNTNHQLVIPKRWQVILYKKNYLSKKKKGNVKSSEIIAYIGINRVRILWKCYTTFKLPCLQFWKSLDLFSLFLICNCSCKSPARILDRWILMILYRAGSIYRCSPILLKTINHDSIVNLSWSFQFVSAPTVRVKSAHRRWNSPTWPHGAVMQVHVQCLIFENSIELTNWTQLKLTILWVELSC